jgi:hypothetical protein
MAVKIIEINWEGPLTFDMAKERKSGQDYGLYQAYGTHNIFGPDTLLYIGQAKEENQTFGVRMSQHEKCDDWIGGWASQEINIYLGKFGSRLEGEELKNAMNEWNYFINISECLLIHFCQPPWNTQHKNKISDDIGEETIIYNYGKRHKLPLEISTFWKQFKNSKEWKTFSI